MIRLMSMLLFAVPGLLAQTVDEILDNHIEAIGGKDKVAAIETLVIKGKTVRGSRDIPFTRYVKLPDKFRNETEMRGQEVVQASDGEETWAIMPMRGDSSPRKMDGRRGGGMRNQTQFFGVLMTARDRGATVKLLGKEDFEGTEVYALEISGRRGTTISYLDTEHYMEIKRVVRSEGRDGQARERVTLFSDYREVAGVMIPHAVENKGGGGPGGRSRTGGRGGGGGGGQTVIDTIEVNKPLEDSLFTMPTSP